MVDPTPSDYNLTYLRERWERDRSSRIFLQLAEEYRRRGLHAEALEVLETGLGFHPGYLAAQVALGRCRLEAGQPEAAVKVLERVLTHDPTQAVATRLLAESWLQLGDEERAQSTIDRCRLIGIPPSELVGLEQRLATARRSSRERWSEPAEERAGAAAPEPAPESPAADEVPLPWQAAPELEPTPEPEPTPEREPLPAAPAAAPPPQAAPAAAAATLETATPVAAESAAGPGRVFRLPPAVPRGVVLPLRPGAERRVVGGRGGDPFGRVGRPQQRPAAATEIFRLLPPVPVEPVTPAAEAPTAAPPPAASAAAPAVPAPQPPAGIGTVPAAARPAEPAPTERWWEPRSEPAAGPAAPAAPAAASPATTAASPPPQPLTTASPGAPAPSPETPAAARWWERPTEAAATPVPAPAAAAPAPAAVAPTPAEAPLPPTPPAQRSPLAETAGVELQPSGDLGALASPELRPSDPGTATLGELYLRQGYVREAEEIFKQVLARDAENEAALAGLEAIGRRRTQKLTAAEIVAGDEDTEVRGLTARKIQLLTRYLGKLRRGPGTNVPRTPQ